jgi:PAS domain S-box-containing protein
MIHADVQVIAAPHPAPELAPLLVAGRAPATPELDPTWMVVARASGDRHPVEVELRESQRGLATLMDHLPGMAYRCRNDPDWTMEFVSRGALDLTGYSSAELIANTKVSYGQLIRVDDREAVFERVQAALQAKTNFRIVYRIAPASGPEKWVWEQGCGVFSAGGELQALEGFITDITEAKSAEETGRRLLLEQTARLAAESAEQRASFLSEASRILAASFDYHTTLATLARLAVPVLADYCVVDVLENDAGLMRLGAAHVDPGKEALLIKRALTGALLQEGPLSDALYRRLSTLAPEHADEDPSAILADAELQSMGGLRPRCSITVPLVVSERVVGAVTLVISESDRRYGPDDLALAEELENARLFHDAQQATHARDHVLAIVAHDLRNPLGVVLTASEMLLDMPSEHDHEHIGMIKASAHRMDRLIEDLLEVTRIESGHLSMKLRAEAVGPLMEEALEMLRPLAVGRAILLESELEAGLPLVRFDSARIMQVISNLVGNALKFTPLAGRVRICCERAGADVRFSVIDTGPGIPPEQLPHIFGRFWQANAADRRGIGLGLSIAEGIVDAHGGRIWVESTQGVGSTFYFTLPVAPVTT